MLKMVEDLWTKTEVPVVETRLSILVNIMLMYLHCQVDLLSSKHKFRSKCDIQNNL